MPLFVVRNDLTKMNVDAIVNAANTSLMAGGGVCGAIFTAAGVEKLQKACEPLAPIQTGDAVITKGFSLPAKYVIHTAGPVYKDGKQDEENQLRLCYLNSLNLAKKHKCKSIAFSLISSGIYGYPKDEALSVATSTISNWLKSDDMEVSLVVFDKAAFELSNELLGDVRSFIDENYVVEKNLRFARGRDRSEIDFISSDDAVAESMALFTVNELKVQTEHFKDVESDIDFESAATPMMYEQQLPSYAPPPAQSVSTTSHKEKKLGSIVEQLDEAFSVTLLRIIDAKGKTDVEVYKRANLDRKLFSKIRKGKGYMPSKKTAVALAVALELSLPETRDLLERAGFALSRSVVFDVIIEYFITRRKYDIYEINNVLFEYDQQLLGS